MMTFDEAIFDPKRPLSLTPREWMYSVEAAVAEEEDLTEKAARRIASQEGLPEPSKGGLEKIDMGIDLLVQGTEIINSGLQDARMADLDPKSRKVTEKIKDLIETAIAPYLVDIINASDSLEKEEDK